jgi:NAD-dependent SIR2 family protein deacetylase
MATDTVTQRLQEAKHVVVFTGVGASGDGKPQRRAD